MSTEIHWFRRPGAIGPDHPGTLNPVYELLDHPIVLGRADDPVITSADRAGRPVKLTHEVALDRVAKLAGVLRLLEVGPGVRVRVAAEVPPVGAVLSRLAVLRLGGLLVEDEVGRIEFVPAVAEAPRDVHQAFDKPVRRLPSWFEGVAVVDHDGEDTPVDLDPVMRDARIEPAAAATLPADLVVLRRADGTEATARELAGSPAIAATMLGDD